MAYQITKKDCVDAVRAIERAAREGWPLPENAGGGLNVYGAAARALSMDPDTIRKRVRLAASEFDVHPTFPVPKPLAPGPSRAEEVKDLKSKLKDAIVRAHQAEDLRKSVLDLEARLTPYVIPPMAKGEGLSGRSIVAHLSDVHRGERIRSQEIDGVNAYSSAISRLRLQRFFQKIAQLATHHWHGPAPDEMVLCLGGDMISGMIHQELLETNELSSPASVKEAAEDIASGIMHWQKVIKKPIRVITVPGNHARLTMKPQSKRRAAHNLDMLVSDFVEAMVRGAGLTPDQVQFYGTEGSDAYFTLYGWSFGLTHGDAMGVGGGKGYIGPIAPITKGHRLLVDNALKTHRKLHYVMTAHYHTTARTPFGFANGSVVGYGQYARDLRADPEPAKQNMLTVHREHGVIAHQEIMLGVPGEGRLYEPPKDKR